MRPLLSPAVCKVPGYPCAEKRSETLLLSVSVFQSAGLRQGRPVATGQDLL